METYVRRRFGIQVAWRMWLFGATFGPEVFELHIGPVLLWFDPAGLHDPTYSAEVH